MDFLCVTTTTTYNAQPTHNNNNHVHVRKQAAKREKNEKRTRKKTQNLQAHDRDTFVGSYRLRHVASRTDAPPCTGTSCLLVFGGLRVWGGFLIWLENYCFTFVVASECDGGGETGFWCVRCGEKMSNVVRGGK